MVAHPPRHRRFLFLLVCLLVALVPIVGAAPPAQAIIDGEDAANSIGAVQVVLNDSRAFCTGSLINEAWVLTAKHCITENNGQPGTTQVYLGDVRWGQGERHDVLGIFPNELLDVALLQLTQRTEMHDLVLPYGFDDPVIGTPATIKGWGGTRGNPDRRADTLQRGDFTVVATTPGSPTMTLGGVSRTSSGDSGAPVIIGGGLICGVHSETGLLTSTAVKTSALNAWIRQTANVGAGGSCRLDTSKKKKTGAQRIMAIGSAQTVGINSDRIGYRNFLASMLGRAGLSSSFVGPDRAGAPPNDRVADGVSIGTGLDYIQDLEKEAVCAVYDYAPDIVTIVAGEEDLVITPTFSGAPARLNALISTIQEVSPRTVVLVASIAPSPLPAYEPLTTQYNASVKQYVQDRANAGQHVAYVDTSDLVISESPSVPVDGSGEKVIVELNPSGFFKEAAAFNLAIDDAVNAGWIPDTLALNKGPCNATTGAKRDLRVMPLGSSTTYGIGSSDGNGYRKTMDDALEQVVESKNPSTGAAGARLTTSSSTGTQRLAVTAADAQDTTPRVDEVGSVRVGTMADRDNEGWPGYRIDGIADKAKCSVATYQPNLVTLFAGGNDVIQDYQLGSALGRLEALVTQVLDGSPAATVLVSNVQRFSDPAMDARGVAFSQSIPGMVDRLAGQGRHVVFVDLGLAPGDVGGDGIHPNDAGYAKVGRAFAAATSSAFDRGWIQPALSEAPDAGSSPCGLTDGGANTSGGGGGGGGTGGGPTTTTINDGRWEDHGVSFGQGFGQGNSYRWDDVNRDGKQELFVVKPDQSWTFYWNGGRTDTGWTGWGEGFSRAAPGGGAVGNQLRFADIDGDGEPDCVRVNLEGTISVSTWNESGVPGQKICGTSFKDGRLAAGAVKADTQIVFADVDGDRRDDYLLVQPRGTTNLWLNRKDGWIKGGQIAGPLDSERIRRWADIDHNGRDDQILITANGGARAWLNEGISQNADGTLQVKLRDIGAILNDTGLPPADMQFVDVGGDGFADFVRTGWTGVTHIWLNRLGLKPAATTDGPIRDFSKDPRWEDHGVSFGQGFGQGNTYQWGDVNNDGKPELFVIKPDKSWTFYWNGGRTDTGWTGWGEAFSRPGPEKDSNAAGSQLKIADMDGDGATDCVFVRGGEVSVSTWQESAPAGQKLCGKPYKTTKISDNCCSYQVVLADVDGDKRADYLEMGVSGNTRLWLNKKEGWKGFGEVVGVQPDGKDQQWRWADLNGDGKADRISVASRGRAHAWLTKGLTGDLDTGKTGLAVADIGEIATDDKDVPPADVQFVDVGGDGRADFVRTGWTGVTHIWLNRLGLTP